MHHPVFTPGLASTYILDATPARHTQGSEALTRADSEPLAYAKYDYANPERARIHRLLTDMNHVVNAVGACLMGSTLYGDKVLLDEIRAVTGWDDLNENDLIAIGERIGTMRHAFNLRDGHNPLRRHVSGRAMGRPPCRSGPLAGITVDYLAQIRSYLRLVDWDLETTVPSPEALRHLNLDFLIADLEQAHVLPTDILEPVSSGA